MVRRKFLQWMGLGAVTAAGRSTGPIMLHDGDGSAAHPFRDRWAHGHLDEVQSRLLYARLQIAPDLQRRFPSYGTCGRCFLPWPVVTDHSTPYEWASNAEVEAATGLKLLPPFFPSQSVFALCEDCWSELETPVKRLPYYMALVDDWQRESPAMDYSVKREQIRRGVLTEGPAAN